MPILILVTISAPLLVIALVMITAGISGWNDFLIAVGVWLGVFSLIVLVIGLGNGMKRVPEDHIRVLHRSGEPFRVLEEGTHYVAEFAPFDSANFSCRPRINSRVPGQDTIADGTAKWVQIGNRESAFEISADTQWKLICEPEGILQAWDYVKRNIDTVKAEAVIYQRLVVPIVNKAIQVCAPEILEGHRREDIEKHYSSGGCVQRVLDRDDSRTVEIEDVNGWQVRFA